MQSGVDRAHLGQPPIKKGIKFEKSSTGSVLKSSYIAQSKRVLK